MRVTVVSTGVFALLIGWALCLGVAGTSRAEGPQSLTLQGGVEKHWTLAEARGEAFNGAQPWVDLSRYPAKDPHYPQHLAARARHEERVGDRILTYFERGFYSVSQEGGDRGYYYTPQGQLYAVDFDSSDRFPIKSYKHHYPDGRLINVSISVSPGEDFVFEPTGQLISHWMGDTCYNAQGKLTTTRTATRMPLPGF